MRAAVIGCGKIGSEFADDPRVGGVYTHAGAYAAAAGVELAGVCDIDAEKAARCAERWNLPRAFASLDEMLERVRPQVVSVCTPDATHAAILRRVLMADSVRGVLAEKPLAGDAAEAETLVALARERGVVLAVNYMRRHAAGHQRVRDRIRDGVLGEIQTVLGLYTKGVTHNGSHWFDLARWLVGEIVAVQAVGGRAPAFDGDPTLDVRVEFAGGIAGVLQGAAGDAFSVFEMDIVGTRGRVRLTDSGHRIQWYGVADSPFYSGYRALTPEGEFDGGLGDALAAAVRDLIACVASAGRAPRCSGEDGVAALRASASAIESAQRGVRVDVRPLAVAL